MYLRFVVRIFKNIVRNPLAFVYTMFFFSFSCRKKVSVAGVVVGAVLVCCFLFCCLFFAVCRCKARRRNLAKMEEMYLNDLNDTVVEKNDKVGIDSPVFESRMIFRNVSNSDEVSAGTSGIGTSKSSKDSSSSDSPSTSSSTSHRSHPADKVYEGD